MSHIFDALQRSEGERSGVASPSLSEATELLRHAERRAASKWETGVLVEELAATEGAEGGALVGPDEGLPDVVAQEDRSEGNPSLTGGELDIFSQFQLLQASSAPQNRLVCLTDRESPAAEAFHLLGVRLRHLRRDRPLKRVLITSTIPQEGKSMIAANLACTLAQRAPHRTLLLEGDLRRPSFSQIFGIGSMPGLSECLQGKRTLAQSIYHLESAGFWILPAGSASGNALEFLQQGALSSLMDQLATWFEWIIIDSPPMLPLADTSVWMRLVDGVLLVTRQGTTQKRQLQKGLEAIEPKKLIGALLNCSKHAVPSDYYYLKPAISAQNNSSTN
jgi:capsular exopolysaccharide synthesis family protein